MELVLNGKAQRADLFLAGNAATHAGPETVLDLLNDDEPFVPAELAGAHACLARSSISVARVDHEVGQPQETDYSPPSLYEVVVVLATGARVKGFVKHAGRPDAARLVDYLNGKNRFFAVDEGARLALVNRDHVMQVMPVAAPSAERPRSASARGGAARRPVKRKATRARRGAPGRR